MRSFRDRLRHAISFEIIGLALVTPLGAWAFHRPAPEFGAVSLASATLATLWNYLFNLAFDHALRRWRAGAGSHRGLGLRIAHALLFEASLSALLIPMIAWSLAVGLVEAFVMDAGIMGFYLAYTFVFNGAYDRLFPVPARHPAR